MFHLRSDIKIAEGLSERKPLGYVMSFSQIYLCHGNILRTLKDYYIILIMKRLWHDISIVLKHERQSAS